MWMIAGENTIDPNPFFFFFFFPFSLMPLETENGFWEICWVEKINFFSTLSKCRNAEENVNFKRYGQKD